MVAKLFHHTVYIMIRYTGYTKYTIDKSNAQNALWVTCPSATSLQVLLKVVHFYHFGQKL